MEAERCQACQCKRWGTAGEGSEEDHPGQGIVGSCREGKAGGNRRTGQTG
jgi:hypothetical protein